ncbi:MAG TPA: RIP metalloprotease RseP [Ignavibacteriales bacterium]|nr:RIP metalloprotease RseP [Ignavibacteriales bacterium]
MDYIIYFIITIGILVFVHEFGHFIAAKICKMRTDIFAIGFGKRLFGWNKINGFTFGDLSENVDMQGHTDYRLCLLPLGGYVKISGMVDESFDAEFADKEPQPYEFRSKPTYQKLFVITAGVLMNLLLTIVIFWGINFYQGKQQLKTTVVDYPSNSYIAQEAGFMPNDKILTVNGQKVEYWEDTYNQLFVQTLGMDLKVVVERNGEKVTLNIPRSKMPKPDSKDIYLIPAEVKPKINGTLKDMPAEKAGLKGGDILLSLNGTKLFSTTQTIEIISSNPGKGVNLVYSRNGVTDSLRITPNESGKIGAELMQIAPVEFATFGFFESINLAFVDIADYSKLTLHMLGRVITGKLEFSQAFSGPVKIAQFAAKSADVGASSFILFLAMLSLSLAIINILPFPVLDGGHFVIILLEGIIRREIPIKIKLAIQNTGFVILLILMAFVIYSDIISL